MARPLRLSEPGLTYHVTARGIDRHSVYMDDEDRVGFLDRLAHVVGTLELECYAYCLMDNHYHLVVKTRQPNISKAMRQVNSAYARRWNDRHERTGYVFQGRFGAKVIQDGRYLLTACRYVVLNPVRAGLVGEPCQWPWSSYRATAGLARCPAFLSTDTVLACFGEGVSAVLAYRRFVCDRAAAEDRLPPSPIVGDPDFVARFKPAREAASREVYWAERDTRQALEELFASAHDREARDTAAARATAAGYSTREVARLLGFTSRGVRMMVERARQATGGGLGPEGNPVSDSDPTP